MLKYFRPRIRTRHPSHDVFRKKESFGLFPFRSVIRFGSSTEMRDTILKGGKRIEVNTVNAIKTAANKLLMKRAFAGLDVKTAEWYIYNTDGNIFTNIEGEGIEMVNLPFPIISKHIHGSRGTGNAKHDTLESLQQWMVGKRMNSYIFEKYYSYTREYRLHVTVDGCFYTCRKMLKQDTPQEHRWYRNDDHCVWIMEENPLFDKPSNWDDIVAECVKSLNAVGLDFGAVDLRIQSATTNNGNVRKIPEFIVIEINSAPSMGEVTEVKYLEELPKILNKKYEQSKVN